MKYEKRVRTKIVLGVIYVLTGMALIVFGNVGVGDTDFMSSFGAVFAVIGLAQIVKNKRLIKNPVAMEKREIAETDERNIMIWEKSRSLAVSVYAMLSGIAVIILKLMGQSFAGQVVAYTLCGFVIIYWMCYFIVKQKY